MTSEGPAIRLLEDDPGQRELRGLLLEAKGFRVVSEGGDLVLMDLCMPRVEDGLRVIREIAAEVPRPKIVVISGYAAALRGREEEEMVDAVLEKPCPTGKLVDTLRRMLA